MPKRSKTPVPISASSASGPLYLRPPKWADFETWVSLRRENRDYLIRWEPEWTEKALTRTAYKARLARFKTLIQDDLAYPFYIFRQNDHQLVGACNLTGIRRGAMQCAEIGYWIAKDYGRQGYAKAAVRAITRFAFDDIGLNRVSAAVSPQNEPSIRILRGNGFCEEGIARGYLKINGAWRDHLIFARLRQDV